MLKLMYDGELTMKQGTELPWKTFPPEYVWSLYDNRTAFEGMHMLLRTFPLQSQELARLAKEMGGKEAVAQLADLIKTEDPVLYSHLKRWYKNNCDGKPSFAMPR